MEELKLRFNVFCPTGPGGGVDSSCGGKGGGDGAGSKQAAKDAVNTAFGKDMGAVISGVKVEKNEDGEPIGYKVRFRQRIRTPDGSKFAKSASVSAIDGRVIFNAAPPAMRMRWKS